MEANYAGYPVYKGLQMPLEFMGIRGRFILIAAATFGAIYLKQRNGLHTKQKEKGIKHYHHLYEH